MFEVPGSDIVEVIISEGVVKDQEPAKYIRRPTESTPEVAHDDDSGFENEEISARNPWNLRLSIMLAGRRSPGVGVGGVVDAPEPWRNVQC